MVLLSCSSDATDTGEEQEQTNTPPVPAVTAIADSAFEQALIDANLDDALDGRVLDSRIKSVTNLIIDDKGITDLSGIGSFDALENLNVRGNELTSLDVSRNRSLKFLWAEDNMLEELTLDGISILEKVGADRNELTLIDVSDNTALQLLSLSDNKLSAIDVSVNLALTDFIIGDNPLSCIQVNQEQLENPPTDWTKDENDTYAIDCN